MRFDNAFLCKNGVVGMQFTKNKDVLISVFHDGQSLKVSEQATPAEQEEALRKYHFIHKRFKSN